MNLFKYFLIFSGYQINKASKSLLELRNFIKKDGLDCYHDKQKKNILSWHIENNPIYCKLQGGKMPKTWSDVRPVKKGDFQTGLKHWISISYRNKRIYLSSTSGSSGHPFWFAKDKECHALTWSSIQKLYNLAGLSLSSRQARFYGIPLAGLSGVKERIKDYLMNRKRFPVFDLSDENLEYYLNIFKQDRFEYIYGYTSALVVFAKFCIKKSITLLDVSPFLKCCIYTSESIGPGEKEILQKGFGVPNYAEYGSSETGIIAFENDNGELIVDDALIYLEEYVLPDGSATTLVTSLYNKAFPIIRYDIGDIVHLSRQKNKTVITDLEGRTNDLILLPNGKKAAGLTFYYISRSILERSGVLKEFIIRQTSSNRFVFEIVSDRVLNRMEEQLIIKETINYLGEGLEISFEYKKAIPRLKNGKIKHFISEL